MQINYDCGKCHVMRIMVQISSMNVILIKSETLGFQDYPGSVFKCIYFMIK